MHNFNKPVAAVCLAVLSAYVQAQDAAYDFNIPAQSLSQVLDALSKQTGLQPFFADEVAKGVRSPGIKGRLTLRKAIETALTGTKLTHQFTGEKSVAIKAAEENVVSLPPIAVTANADSYKAETASVGNKIEMELREIPQSVSVLTQQRMQDQNLTEATQALQWVTGVVNSRSNESDAPLVTARGFRMDNVTIDGMRAGGSFWQIPADLSAYEQIEVLRGPSGLFNGSGTSGSPGGAINYRRKRPTTDPLLNLDLTAGSWDHYRAAIDASGALNDDKTLRGRMVASALDTQFHVDNASRENQSVYGVLDYDLTPGTKITVGADMERRRSQPYYKQNALRGDGSNPGWSREHNAILPWGRWYGDTTGAFAEFSHAFNENWSAKASYSYRHEKLFWDWAWITGYVDPIPGSTQKPLYITGQRRDTDMYDRSLDVNITGKFDLFGRSHDVVLGWNNSQTKSVTHQPNTNDYSYDTIDNALVDQNTLDTSGFPWRPSTLSGNPNTYRYEQSGAYASLRFRLLDPLALTTGARLSNYDYGGRSNNTLKNSGAYDKSGVVTPFWALTWDLNPSTSIYFSHAEVFNVTNAYTIEGKLVDPVVGNNREIGLKTEFFEGRLLASIAAYRLYRENQTRIDPSAPNPCPASPIGGYCYIADNEQRVQGVDLELTGNLTRNWQIMVGANTMKKRYIRWLDGKGQVSSTQGQGWWLDDPENTLKVWSAYRLPGAGSAWRVGGGFRWQSETYAERSANGVVPAARVTQSSYAVWDTLVSYDIDKTWSAQANVTNLFDKTYYSRVSTSYVSYGEPRNITLTLRAKF